jgi:osmotically-inducible protein OsmY
MRKYGAYLFSNKYCLQRGICVRVINVCVMFASIKTFNFAEQKLLPNYNYCMRSNEELQKDVLDAIKWEPLLNVAEIGVTAKDGVITLTGVVDSYAQKVQAQNAAKNVIGVKAVAEVIEVNYGDSFKKNDTEIANEVLNAFKVNWEVPNDRITVNVENGWVTLEGVLERNFQKEVAKHAVEHLAGVKAVTNNITIRSDTTETLEKAAVENAIDRTWSLNTEDIKVNIAGDKVILTGSVNSLYQKEEAGRIAWGAPGVGYIDNQLVVEYKSPFEV